jgi:hypothetical protein
MKKTVLMDKETLLKKGMKVLMRELGPVETTRFLSLFPAKHTESVKRHRAWQSKLDKASFFKQVFTSK